MLAVRILGDLEIIRDGVPVELPPRAKAQTLIVIAASGPSGITGEDLGISLGGLDPSNRERRTSDLRTKHQIPITPLSTERCYRLGCAVDAWSFIEGVTALTAPDPAAADELMRLWRGNPIPGPGQPDRRAWQPVIAARDRLVEVLSTWPPDQLRLLTALPMFAELFPDDWRLQRVRRIPSGKPLLLVVEDQVMADIVELLEDEFDIIEANSYEEWNEIRKSGLLGAVDAALVDRHLDQSRPQDSLGTTKVATHLRTHTEIPVTLMSVDVDCSTNKQLELCHKYRLMDVIRKHADGRINASGLVDAARAMTDRSPRAWSGRMRRWVESVAYQVQDESLAGLDNPDVTECLAERDRVVALLERGPREQAADAVRQYRSRWDRSASAARS